jgi:hypothetical protein
MDKNTMIRRGASWLAAGAAVAAGAYASYAAVTWLRYGKAMNKRGLSHADDLLDRFMPDYEVVERHHVRVKAPPEITLAVAKNTNVLASPVARGLFIARAWALGANVEDRTLPATLADQMQAIGWRVLAETPGREIVFGAVTKPWQAEPEFRGLLPSAFLAFSEPDYVKIVWNVRADPSDIGSIFRSETRVCTTDAGARAKFRRYWALVSPGVVLIRRAILAHVKREAEHHPGATGAPRAA